MLKINFSFSENSKRGCAIVAKVGLLGEKLELYTEEGSSKVEWSKFKHSPQELKWYKVRIQVSKV